MSESRITQLGEGGLTRGSLQAWALLTSLPTQISRASKEQRQLQKDYLRCRRDLNATSSQDEFAKWAKLRRQHDKLLDELEKKSRRPAPLSQELTC